MKNKLRTLLSLLLLFALTLSISGFAGQWIGDGNGWKYQKDDGSYAANGWQWIDGNGDGIEECYYFDEAGYCLMDALAPDGSAVDSNGAWIVNGIVQERKAQGAGEASGNISGNASESALRNAASGAAASPGGAAATNGDASSALTAPETAAASVQGTELTYVLNKNTKKFHYPSCSSVGDIKPQNRADSSLSRQEIIAMGYVPCKKCNP